MFMGDLPSLNAGNVSTGQDPSRLRPIWLASDGPGTTRVLLDHLQKVRHPEPRMERGEGVHAQDGLLGTCPCKAASINVTKHDQTWQVVSKILVMIVEEHIFWGAESNNRQLYQFVGFSVVQSFVFLVSGQVAHG